MLPILLTFGLGLTEPWRVGDQSLDLSKKPSELRLEVEAARVERYPCPECGVPCKAHDLSELLLPLRQAFIIPKIISEDPAPAQQVPMPSNS